jgi:hypothetical protein
MNTVTKSILKREIDQLDDGYLELVYNILRQFPHRPLAQPSASTLVASESEAERDPVRHSQAICYAVNEDFRDVKPFADIAAIPATRPAKTTSMASKRLAGA